MTNPRQYRAQPIDPTQAGEDGFVYGDLRHTIDPFTKEPAIHGIEDYIKGEYYPIIPSTVGQDTGRRDNNKKLVFSGDKIRYEVEDCGHTYKYEGVIVWGKEDLQWQLDFQDGKLPEPLCDYENIEVIGTIHDKEQEST